MDTFFENGAAWNASKASHSMRVAGIEDWRWTKKTKAEDFEGEEDERSAKSGRR